MGSTREDLSWPVIGLLSYSLLAQVIDGGGPGGAVSADEYRDIVAGMGRDEVANIIGGFGDMEMTGAEIITVHYDGEDEGEAYFRFERGIVVSQQCTGLAQPLRAVSATTTESTLNVPETSDVADFCTTEAQRRMNATADGE